MSWHPWRALRSLGHVTLAWHDGGPAGVTIFATETVSLRRGMSQAQRRSVLTHELEHLAAGGCPEGHRRADEMAVARAAAKKMIGLRELGEALAWAHCLDEAADELWCDRFTLDVRLEHLHPAEKHYLTQRLSEEP